MDWVKPCILNFDKRSRKAEVLWAQWMWSNLWGRIIQISGKYWTKVSPLYNCLKETRCRFCTLSIIVCWRLHLFWQQSLSFKRTLFRCLHKYIVLCEKFHHTFLSFPWQNEGSLKAPFCWSRYWRTQEESWWESATDRGGRDSTPKDARRSSDIDQKASSDQWLPCQEGVPSADNRFLTVLLYKHASESHVQFPFDLTDVANTRKIRAKGMYKEMMLQQIHWDAYHTCQQIS